VEGFWYFITISFHAAFSGGVWLELDVGSVVIIHFSFSKASIKDGEP
jgi:hypothetical protein